MRTESKQASGDHAFGMMDQVLKPTHSLLAEERVDGLSINLVG